MKSMRMQMQKKINIPVGAVVGTLLGDLTYNTAPNKASKKYEY